MKLELKNLYVSQQRINDIRSVGKPHTLKESIYNKRPYSLESVKLEMDDWQALDLIVSRSIAAIHHRPSTLSEALTNRVSSLDDSSRYTLEGSQTFREYKLDWNSHVVR